jgi:pyrophosphate--fructose-6-phosphate 1-phosphotransferase
LIYPFKRRLFPEKEHTMDISPLQKARYAYLPKLPPVLRGTTAGLALQHETAALPPEADRVRLSSIFPLTYGQDRVRFVRSAVAGGVAGGQGLPGAAKELRVGVILSGGPAPGGHNVIAGLFDGLKSGNTSSKLVGFRGGPGGLVDDKSVEITADLVAAYRNTGGFDIIGSGRTKIETPEQFAAALATATRHGLDAVVVVGGDDSNTNAALLAEYFAAQAAGSGGRGIAVVGVPKTIDGDLKNEDIEASFGFDTATKLYSELVGNIERDSASGRKYWHFIKLMGRSASHIGLEVALQTRPNVALISEEVEAKKLSLGDIVGEVCSSVCARAEKGENFGVVLVPEGLIEFVPEMKALIGELNELLAANEAAYKALAGVEEQKAFIASRLKPATSGLFKSLPPEIQTQLLWDRDPHGNVQVSRIETEKLLAAMVKNRLAELAKTGAYRGKFDFQTHFLGYEGRCAFPSNFDADYCYSLGYTAFALVAAGLTGYLSSVKKLSLPADRWEAGGVPLVSMMNIERRHGQDKPVIKKALVELEGRPFKLFAAARAGWALSSDFRVPGPMQYFGSPEVTDRPTETLILESGAQG